MNHQTLKEPLITEEIFREADNLFTDKFTRFGTKEAGCVMWTAAACAVLIKRGFCPLPQAGSAFWRVCPPHKDDGTRPLNFGYKWNPATVRIHEAVGCMAEIHCWAFVPERGVIVDLATGGLEAQFRRLENREWEPECKLPNWLELDVSKSHDGVDYCACKDAIAYALPLITEVLSYA